MIDDRYLLVRAAAIYVTALLTAAAVLWRRPDRRTLAGALLAFAWNLPALLMVHVAAIAAGWWSYDAEGGVLLGMPVDLWLAWAMLWGPVPAIAMPRAPLWTIAALALLIDLVAMPAAAPVVRLGPAWLIGEFVGIVLCLVPAQLLARWTSTDRHLVARASLQVVAFSGLLAWLIPLVAIEGSRQRLDRSADAAGVGVQPGCAVSGRACHPRTLRRAGIRHAGTRHPDSVRSASTHRDHRHLCLRRQSDAAVGGALLVPARGDPG